MHSKIIRENGWYAGNGKIIPGNPFYRPAALFSEFMSFSGGRLPFSGLKGLAESGQKGYLLP